MSESTKSFVFQNVWEEKSDELARELIQFWIDHKALEQAEAERRVDQVAMVVRDAAGTLVAVSTVKLGFNRSLGTGSTSSGPLWRSSAAFTLGLGDDHEGD